MRHTVVLITDLDLGDGELERALLRDRLGTDPIIAQCRTEEDVLREVEQHAPDAIITQWAPITARVLDIAERCRVVGRIGIGVDMIDVAAADARGVPVLNVPHYCTEEVATHAVALAMALWRRLPQFDADLRAGGWGAAAAAPRIGRLSEATIGLVGAGRIGSRVGRVFAAWETRVLITDPAGGDHDFENVTLEALTAQADIISLHAPLTDESRRLIDDAFLARLDRAPILVNTSRGGLVDTDAVAGALETGILRGAGLDVFEDEPLPAGHKILAAPNTILTPHAAWCSAEALPELRRQAVLNVVDALSGHGTARLR